MEYVEGQSVASMVRSRGRLDEVEALDIAIRVARSLAEAQEYGIVHRDVKPSNIKVSKWGVVKLMDFGVARLTGDLGDPSVKQTVTLGVVGTPTYMSPEQARGSRGVDFRTDMYSLGATLYHMLTGSAPYAGDTPQDVLGRIAEGPPTDIRERRADLSERTVDIVNRTMARRPEERFDSFAELIGAMEAARDHAAAAAKGASSAAPAGPAAGADWRRTFVVAGLVVLLGLAAAYVLHALFF